ncbi:MAG: pyruvate dehydrogenase complex E1 component subunit beta [Polyangiales bacterium]
MPWCARASSSRATVAARTSSPSSTPRSRPRCRKRSSSPRRARSRVRRSSSPPPTRARSRVKDESTMREIRYREALREAIAEEMERDERVFLMGEEVGRYQGAYKVTEGLFERFGERRIIDAPIAENGFAGIGIGAAMVGLRPIIEFMTFNFSAVAFDQIISNAAKVRQMSGGQFTCPIVFRGPNGSARQVGSQHSQSFEAFYAHVPGLKVVAPAFAGDAKGLLKAAIRDDNPVCFLESETLYGVKGEVPDPGEGDHLVELGKARVVHEGTDVTIVSWSRICHVALAAIALLEKEGISAELVDLRSLRPLDEDTILKSVTKTHRVVVAHEGWPYGGVGAEVVDRIQRLAFDELDAPILRVTGTDVPMPYNAKLEQGCLPQPDGIVAACKRVLYRD